VKPKSGGGRIEWPVSGWPRHGPLIFAFLVVLVALFLALLLFGARSAGNSPAFDSGVTAQPADSQ
jgi:hypothetical protein